VSEGKFTVKIRLDGLADNVCQISVLANLGCQSGSQYGGEPDGNALSRRHGVLLASGKDPERGHEAAQEVHDGEYVSMAMVEMFHRRLEDRNVGADVSNVFIGDSECLSSFHGLRVTHTDLAERIIELAAHEGHRYPLAYWRGLMG
jgi:hypothetical protein